MVNWHFFEREILKDRLCDLADKLYNGEELKADELELVKEFAEFNCHRGADNNIKEFFGILDSLLVYINKRGDIAENED